MQFVTDFLQNTKAAFQDLQNPQLKKSILIIFALQFLSVLFSNSTSMLLAILVVPILFAVTLAEQYYAYKTVHILMPSPKKGYDFLRTLKIFLLFILQGLCALFSVFDPKWLLLPVIGSTLFVTGALTATTNPIASIISFSTAAILIVLYCIIIFRNLMRLSVTIFEYLQNPTLPLFSSFQVTWQKTSGKALKLFARFITFGLLISLPISLAYFVLFLIGTFVDTLLGLPVHLFSALLATPFITLMVVVGLFYSYRTYVTLISKTKEAPVIQVPPKAKAEPVIKSKVKLVSKKQIKKK